MGAPRDWPLFFLALSEDYDLNLLDVMLPELDGLEVLKRSRTKPSGLSPLKQRRWR
ncbi:DNA-binding response OmpR family regulator [Paraburkholderia sp. WSM4177]|nr:DNA-binding response OmpR family regulator [Paraburkholderia sp. WSM4177]MBB5487989.1 DNA-binding response OmpR family regulator [Paraburkholderia sp. WSM4180]